MSRRRELLRAVTTGGVVAIAGCGRLDPNATAEDSRRERLQASDGIPGDHFGYSVSTSHDGRLAAIGAPWDRNSDDSVHGSVYVFSRSETGWRRHSKLQVDDDSTMQLGQIVEISGDGRTVFAGTNPLNATGSNGTVYVFSRIDDGWRRQTEFVPDRQGERFVRSIAVSDDGSAALVGAIGGSDDAGRVYHFDRSDGGWNQRTVIEPAATRAVESFGESVALSDDGSTAIIDARTDARSSTGAVASVYSLSDGRWFQQNSLDDVVPDTVRLLDHAVALSGDASTAAVNAVVDDEAAVLVFSRTERTWRREATLPLDDVAERFGRSVAMSGDGRTVVVGADRRDALVDGGGIAYVFDRGSGDWERRMELALDDGTDRDSFARSVAVSHGGTRIFVGAHGEGDVDDRLGNVYVFDTTRD